MLAALLSGEAEESESVARQWNEALLQAIRVDTPRPTVHARNLFHVSAAMYDAWAAYDGSAAAYFAQEPATATDVQAAREEAISYAAYRVLEARFANSPGADQSLPAFDSLMAALGYDPEVTTTEGDSPAAVGNRIAQAILEAGLADGANEQANYGGVSDYEAVNAPLVVANTGAQLDDPNRWQPLTINGVTQKFLTPHWGDVATFAISRDGDDAVYYDPGAPPQLGEDAAAFHDAIVRVLRFSSWLDPGQNVMVDRSPGAIGNNSLGADDGTGRDVNPITGEPYAENLVNRGDYGRVLAEFWADGPHSETPPGHWNVIANHASDSPLLEKRIGGQGPVVDDLEWDVKLYLALNGAVHDAAIAAWDVKEAYDYVRPISMIRYLGGLGQSSDPDGPSYHPQGLPLVDGLIEVVTAETTAPGGRHEHLVGHEGDIAVFAWAGHPDNPEQTGGVDWILAEDWLPYQAADFVTPAFAGFVSGHSTFSRASAEVLAAFTGSEFFPGGIGTYTVSANEYLRFENGPTSDVTLQWATYFDAADEAGISRLYGGIHVDADDYDGRIIGSQVGQVGFARAAELFAGLVHPWRNPVVLEDVDASGAIGPEDLLEVVGILRNNNNLRLLSVPAMRAEGVTHYPDTNGDDAVTFADLQVVVAAVRDGIHLPVPTIEAALDEDGATVSGEISAGRTSLTLLTARIDNGPALLVPLDASGAFSMNAVAAGGDLSPGSHTLRLFAQNRGGRSHSVEIAFTVEQANGESESDAEWMSDELLSTLTNSAGDGELAAALDAVFASG